MYTNNQQISKNNYQQMYERARHNLMIMIIFTIINIILYFAGSTTILLFAAVIPYAFVTLSELFVSSFASIILLIAVANLLLYFLCWIFSKKHFVWMIVALVFFAIDTVVLVFVYYNDISSGIIDFLIHIWVLYYLIMGVYYGIKLRKEKKEAPQSDLYTSAEQEENINNDRLCEADMTIKYRVLCECEALGYHILYRRIKSTNELVIDGYVYDNVEMLIEPPHSLNAHLNGHHIQVGYNGIHSFIKVDGELVARKIRVW